MKLSAAMKKVIGERIGRLTVTGPGFFRWSEAYGSRVLWAALVCDCGERVPPRRITRARSTALKGHTVQCKRCNSRAAYLRLGTMTNERAARIMARK